MRGSKTAGFKCGGRDSNPRRPTPEDLKSSYAIKIDYKELRSDFIRWLEAKGYSKNYIRPMLNYLDKYAPKIRQPMDIVELCAQVKKRVMEYSLRALLNFAEEILGLNVEHLKRAVPCTQSGVDVKRATMDEIVKSLMIVNEKASLKYKAVYNALLESGLRLSEVKRLIENVKAEKYERHDGFCIVEIGQFRRVKLAYYAFISNETLEMIKAIDESFNEGSASRYISNVLGEGVVSWKYLRKYAFSAMRKLGMPESTADFVQGRLPKAIGGKHYAELLDEAIQFYPPYLRHVRELRAKAMATA